MSKPVTSARFRTESRQLSEFLLAGIWLLGLYLFAEVAYEPLKALGSGLFSNNLWGPLHRVGVAAIDSLPALALFAALLTSRRLFNQFAQGEVFTETAGLCLMRVGDWLFASALAAMIVSPALLLLVGEDAAKGLRLEDQSIVLLCVGLAVRLLGRAFRMASAIKAENDLMI